jgi:hypothetical protein
MPDFGAFGNELSEEKALAVNVRYGNGAHACETCRRTITSKMRMGQKPGEAGWHCIFPCLLPPAQQEAPRSLGHIARTEAANERPERSWYPPADVGARSRIRRMRDAQ